MATKYAQVPTSALSSLQINAGILASDFTPSTGTVVSADILGATSGGLSFSDIPDFVDFAEDIDNAPKNTKEFKRINGRTVTLSATFISINTTLAKSLMAAADIGSVDTTKITPRDELAAADFDDLWLICDYSDKNGPTNGGFVAIHLMNALSTGGFQLQTADKGKGQFQATFTAHYSGSALSTVPYEVYIKAGSAEPTT